MEPIGLFKPMTTRPLSQWSRGRLAGAPFVVGSIPRVLDNPPPLKERSPNTPLAIQNIRDNFTLSTWLLLGACMQSLLIFLLPSRLALAPAFLIILYRLLDTSLMTMGLRKNRYIEESIPGKFSAQIPDAQGRYSKEPSSSDVCVFLIGARSNQ